MISRSMPSPIKYLTVEINSISRWPRNERSYGVIYWQRSSLREAYYGSLCVVRSTTSVSVCEALGLLSQTTSHVDLPLLLY